MAVVQLSELLYVGLAADVKPTTAERGSTFIEYDTGSRFLFDGGAWRNANTVATFTSSDLPAIKANSDTEVASLATLASAVSGGKFLVTVATALAAGTNNIGLVDINSIPAASDTADCLALGASATIGVGMTTSRTMSAASTNATSTKASAGKLFSVVACNVNAAVRYLKIYNKASAPTVGTDTPVFTIPLLTNQNCGFTTPIGFALGTGIAWALTTGFADSDTAAVAANEISVTLGWK